MTNPFRFSIANLKGDLFGGITAGIVALPLALAFGAQTELGAISGLYGAISIGILAALFGGTPTQVSGPTAPMTVVSAVIIMDAIAYAGGVQAAFPIIIATFFIAGLFEFLLGVMRVGRYIRYMPYPVVSGFMSGIGVIIVISQIFPMFGSPAPTGGAAGTLSNLGEIPGIANWYSVGLTLITVAIIYLFPKITKVIPGSLAALIAVTAGAFFILTQGQVPIIETSTPGGVPAGLPKVHLSFFSVLTDIKHLMVVFEYAFTLGALGAIDSLLTSVVADNMTKTKHDSNQELLGQGIGNMASAMIGGLPGAGATMRTVINIKSGAKTKISGIMAGLFLLAVLLGIGPLVGIIPNSVLAGILFTVGIGIIDYKGFRHLKAIPRTDAIIMITVLLLTVLVGLLEAVAIGMVMAALLFMKSIADVVENKTKFADLKEFAQEVPWADEGSVIEKFGQEVYIKHLDGPLFFGFASRFQQMIKALPKIKVFIIRMEKVPYVDQSGLYAMEDAVQELSDQGIRIVFSGLHGQPEDMFERIKLAPGLISKDFCFPDFQACLTWLKGHLEKSQMAVS
ncbi:MAG TPA: SulP family inorganic anion transporter [Flavilitoribacter sp.]|nr:SulP family inorganic anion transporter [Flavilitoribacter sp.]HMQ85941.1 SulP family inorganic anion transporter [Flavilitoribacter sp.]